jgi:hypothetical protein
MAEKQRKLKEWGYKYGQINTAVEKILNKRSVPQKSSFLRSNYLLFKVL